VTPARRLLLVTNDFPPRQGGIQSMLFELVRRLPAEQLAVYCSNYPGAAEFDRSLDFPVRRHPTGLLVPSVAARRRVLRAAADWGSSTVWFGAAAPLALLAPALRRHGITRMVATTHGHEVGWARLPVARQALRRIGDHVDAVTYLGEYTRSRLAPALGRHPELVQLTPGVDTDIFSPAADGQQIRARHGLDGRPVIVCVSRLVPRKGQDALVAALPAIRDRVRRLTGPGAAGDVVLLIVGDGPYRSRLEADAARFGVTGQVVFTGPVTEAELPGHYAAGDVFAMPCRTRRHGLDVEGLGIVYLEASAVGLAVVAGRSGGAPDAVLDGRTGVVVDGTQPAELVDAITGLLLDRSRARQLGAAGRRWVEEQWQWDALADRLVQILQL
jgi:phosphatidylinositol alpha-1,6-mannosyltransferase